MSDDLVKRLREGDHFERVMSAEEAADRIEELEARVAAADKLAEAVRKTGYRIDHKGVITLIDSFGMMPINAALAAYQATKEGG